MDLVYAVNERPPPATLLVLGAQHAATTMAFIAYVLVTARAAGLDAWGTQSMVAMTLLGLALCSALQAWGGRLGSGALLVHMPNPFMIAIGSALVAAHGPGGLAGATVLYAVVAMVLAPLLRHMRVLFPPPVVGVVICMAGIALVSRSVQHALGVGDDVWDIDPISTLIAGLTLGVIVVLSIWGSQRLRLMALLLAIGAGVSAAALLGRLEGAEVLQNVPLLALPHLSAPVFALNGGMMVAVILIAVLTQLDTLGSAIILDKMDDADWKRANLQVVSGAVRANGLGDFFAGLLGSFPSCVSSANIALVYATRASARVVGLVTAALLALVAFLPQVTMALTLIPVPVLGAVALYAAGFLMVSGMEVLTSRAMDSRGMFAVGLSMSAGLAVMQLPQLTAQLPPSLHFLFGDGFVVAGLLVMGLNLLFRIGTAQSAEQALHPGTPELHAEITGFVERQGAAWGARRAVVQRAALAALEAAEAIAGAGDRTLTGIRGSFDEFNLDLELLHSGPPLELGDPTAAPASAALLDGDDHALDAALAQISGRLLRHLADRVNASQVNGQSTLRLHFEH